MLFNIGNYSSYRNRKERDRRPCGSLGGFLICGSLPDFGRIQREKEERADHAAFLLCFLIHASMTILSRKRRERAEHEMYSTCFLI